MKKTRRILYSVVLAIAAVALSLFALACGGDKAPATKYTLTFMNGTAPYYTITGTAGSNVNFDKENPERTNLVFDGWSRTDGGEIVEIPSKMPAENITYYAVFSVRYTVTLNAGAAGTLPETERSVEAKAGVNLYELVSGITPTAVGDATFDGWFYDSSKLTSTSETLMPERDITVNAKYKVNYVINEYKQQEYGVTEGDNAYGNADKKSESGYVGEFVYINNYVGYEFNEDKDDRVITVALASTAAQNTYDVYYDISDYSVMFNHNLPSDITVNGSMETVKFGHNHEYDVPECEYSADGYRFAGWTTDAVKGEVEYRLGGKIKVTGVTTLYAIWDKAYTDASQTSSDYIYIADNAQGTAKVAYLDRLYLAEQEGTYDAATNIFTFKNAANEVVLRGVVNKEDGTFVYLNGEDDSTHKLRSLAGDVNDNVTLVINADGSAVYTEGENDPVNGKYGYDSKEGSMKFTADADSFFFRLGTERNDDGTLTSIFEIRGDEYGTWYSMNALGEVDENKYISLDGYGSSMVYVIGYNNSLQAALFSVRGIYRINDAENNEIAMVLYNGSNTRTLVGRFIEGEYGTEDHPHDKVFVEWQLGVTVYAAPESGDVDTSETASKIVLDGYGIYNNSAVYTYHDIELDQDVTVEGSYYLDIDAGTYGVIYITPKNGGDVITFVLNAVEQGEDVIFTFKEPCTLYGDYAITGLENSYRPGVAYTFRILNDTDAEFRFMLPLTDRFYGQIVLELYTMISGTYSVVDAENNEYEFIAEYDASTAYVLYNIYNNIFGQPLSTDSFWKFRFTLDAANKAGSCVAVGDSYDGIQLVYEGVTYTTDGYGKAVAESGEEKDYIVNTSFGLTCISLRWDSGEKDSAGKPIILQQLYTEIDGVYRAYVDEYASYNADLSGRIRMVRYEGDYAVLMFSNVMYAYGMITWENADTKEFGKYTQVEAYSYAPVMLVKEYSEFRFGFIDVNTSTDPNKPSYEARFFIYDAAEITGDVSTITGENGATLIINRKTVTAEYRVPDETAENGYTSIEGSFRFGDDILVLVYDNNTKSMSFKLEYTGEPAVVTSFKVVGTEVGNWLNMDDNMSYLYLTGEKNDGDNYVAYYHLYDEETETFTDYDATYTAVPETNGEFILTYVTGTDEDGESVTSGFRFMVGYASGLPYYMMYRMYLGDGNTTATFVYSNASAETAVGFLYGGAYSTQYFVDTNRQRYAGELGFYSGIGYGGYDVYRFLLTDGSNGALYFLAVPNNDRITLVMLDGLFTAPNFGFFESIDGTHAITVPTNSGNMTIDVERIRVFGNGIVYLVFTAEEDVSAVQYMYLRYSNTEYAVVGLNGENISIITLFRLYTRTGTDGEIEYLVRFIDFDTYGTFSSDDLSTLMLNGFGSAVYTDRNGVAYSATYTVVEGSDVIRLVYGTVTTYVVVDTETGSFEEIFADDPRYPTEPTDPDQGGSTEGGTTGGGEEQNP